VPLRLLVFVRELADGDAGIVDQDVEPAEAGGGLGGQALAFGLFRHVGGDEAGGAAETLGGLLALGDVAARQHHGGAGGGQAAGHAQADAAIAAGDHRHLARQIEQFHAAHSPWVGGVPITGIRGEQPPARLCHWIAG